MTTGNQPGKSLLCLLLVFGATEAGANGGVDLQCAATSHLQFRNAEVIHEIR